TTFTANGHGLDPLGNDISYANGYTNERASTTVEVINPDTGVTITPADNKVLTGTSTTLKIEETNAGDADLTGVYVVLLKDGAPYMTLEASTAAEDKTDNDVLEDDETMTWDLIDTGVLTTDTVFQATGHGFDPLGNDITFDGGYTNERAEITIEVISPHTTASISVDPKKVKIGGSVTLTVRDYNDGDVSLTSSSMDVESDPPGFSVSVDKSSPYYAGGDLNGNDEMDPGEEWEWVIPGVVINDTVTFIATGHGFDPIGNDISVPDYPTEQVDVEVEPVRRVPGASTWSIIFMIAGLAGAMLFLSARRKSRSKSG
ncbi:MAG: hypothetical protein JXA46_01165, partial [Dehalococcoidales bacterium]|nr:hypothetical protein [Dehalococcoidales bacterium]